MKNRLLLLGNGGHAHVILDTLLELYEPNALGIIDGHTPKGSLVRGVCVLGGDEELPALYAAGYEQAVLGVGSVENCSLRMRLTDELRRIGFSLPVVVDPGAMVSAAASIAEGTYIGKRAVVQPDAQIGRMCILNTGCIIEHDCRVGDYGHISCGATLLGNVHVGERSFVGGGSVIRHGARIGENVVIGAGSVVVCDIPGNCVAYGNPCKVRK